MRLETKGPSGRRIQLTAPTAGLTGGDIVILASGVNGACGVVLQDASAGETAIVEVGGEIKIPKNAGSGLTISQFALVYRDASTGKATATASGNALIGRASLAAGAADTHVWVLLKPPTH